MYKEDLALNNLQWLIGHKTKAKENSKEKKDVADEIGQEKF